MPKSPEKTFNATPKKRGRKKKFGRRVSQGKELKPVPDKTTSNDLESITAQTATNLKAFRSLFGSQKETPEEFDGFGHKETMSIKMTCRWRRIQIQNEITKLENFVLDAPAPAAQPITPPLPFATTSRSIPQLLLLRTEPRTGVTLNRVIAKTAYPIAPDLKFSGFLDSDPLKDTCHNKSQKLFQYCEELALELRNGEKSEANLHPSICPADEPKATHDDVKGVIRAIKIISKNKSRIRKGSRTGSTLEFPGNTPSMNLKDFVQTQSIAGEITVTPILDTPKPVRGHKSPFRISCLPKT